MTRRPTVLLLCLLIGLGGHPLVNPLQAKETAPGTAKKRLELVDLMRLRQIEDTAIADNGSWVAYALVPDRGDPSTVIASIDGETRHRITRGRGPKLTADGAWAAARVEIPAVEAIKQEKKGKKKSDDGPKPGLALVETASGDVRDFERVKNFAFSADGRWLIRHHDKPIEKPGDDAEETAREAAGEREEEEIAEEETAEEVPTEEVPAEEEPPAEEPPVEETAAEEKAAEEEAAEETDEEDEEIGTILVLRALASGDEIEIEHVDAFAADDVGRFVAYAIRAPGGVGNGVFVRDLRGETAHDAITAHAADGTKFHALSWSERPASDLAFIVEPAEDDPESADAVSRAVEEATATDTPSPPDTALFLWTGSTTSGSVLTTSHQSPEGWYLPAKNELSWSRDARRLFFGYRPRNAWQPPDDKEDSEGDSEEEGEDIDLFDVDQILEDRTVDVWHVNDPLIQTNQREAWDDEQKRLYRAVFHRPESGDEHRGRAVLLATEEIRDVDLTNNPRGTLGRADVPYLRERTWDGFFFDLYWVSLEDGRRHRIAERLSDTASLSPDGRFVTYFETPHWYLWDSESETTRNLTADLEVSFRNEDHDYPRAASSYGVGDWLEDGSVVLINDKYDIWSFSTVARKASAGAKPFPITAGKGRAETMIYRTIDLDPDRDGIAADEALTLSGYHDRQKFRGLYRAYADRQSVEAEMVRDDETIRFVKKARDADALLLSRESYTRFPDLWTANADNLRAPVRLSDANPETSEFGWGQAELVEWRDLDGRELQGILIKPAGYRPGVQYPVLVYFYRFFSQRLHLFNEPAVNHRPSFPVYASDGYAVFLPDVRFEIGRPGMSAVKALVPGIQKLIEMGVADPDAIGLHGHSWSGYQTAFVVTQTNIFAAAVAGAPVSNMTSAYGGIRWGSGLARQFQYEKGQSRLGTSLWQGRDRYIDNSPLFFADRIETPLMLMHGDEDDAVPWYQSIELYLALRRLGKEAVFLQYRGEPHHPKKYANKLDYSIKMKAYFDHYLKGVPAPVWLTDGVPYAGD